MKCSDIICYLANNHVFKLCLLLTLSTNRPSTILIKTLAIGDKMHYSPSFVIILPNSVTVNMSLKSNQIMRDVFCQRVSLNVDDPIAKLAINSLKTVYQK